MHKTHLHETRSAARGRRVLFALLSASPLIPVALATEGGGSVYPIGAETVLTGTAPAPGASVLANFDLFYQANGFADSQGRNVVPGFHLRAVASALKFQHNWGVHLLGGTLVSFAVVPAEYAQLDGALGKGNKTAVSNLIFEPAAVAYERGDWHWWYGLDYFAPSFSYDKTALVNIGQHNSALAPVAAFSYLPSVGTEVSSKFQYIVNGENNALAYTSGNEFIWEYALMQNISKKVSLGANGYYYQQTTADCQDGANVIGGNRGRDLAIGPQIRVHAGPVLLIAKYTRDTLVRNRAIGNAFWLEAALPLGRGHE